MELNGLIFPKPKPSYTLETFKGEIIWVPSNPPIPCLYLEYPRGSSKILLYFHGNAEDIGLAYDLVNHLRATLMVHILSIEYPGYGIYKGSPSASQILSDAKKVFEYLTGCLKVDPKDILLFGRSIGTGPATELAAIKDPGALMLMSGYTSLREVVASIVGKWVAYLVKERFRNIDLIRRVECPTFIVHGEKDSLIPFSHSEALHYACDGPCSLMLPKDMDHNEFDFFEDLSIPFSSFLIECGVSVFPNKRRFIKIPKKLFDNK